MDIKRALRNVQDTGKVTVGFKETRKSLRSKKVKLVIVAKNCPEGELEELKAFKVPIYTFTGNNAELGASSGKPFSISTMGIIDGGKSDILLLKGETE
ncbi:MAG: 50S ribosomal protein L30e [Candidatus Thermoplasmatota archaeon]|nr:50S ribosomal protein L30e [Candidatus Thermoplasmatota archaeon]